MTAKDLSCLTLIMLSAAALLILSCSDSPDYKLCYSNEDGSTIVTERSTHDMLKSLKKSKWPYTWNEATLTLSVGEISEEIEAFGEPVDQMFLIEFERCAEGIIVSSATMVMGEREIPSVLGSPGIAPEETADMRHSAAVNLPFMLGEYKKAERSKKKRSGTAASETSGNTTGPSAARHHPTKGMHISNTRQQQAQWQSWAQMVRSTAISLSAGERVEVQTPDGGYAEITHDNVEEIIHEHRPSTD